MARRMTLGPTAVADILDWQKRHGRIMYARDSNASGWSKALYLNTTGSGPARWEIEYVAAHGALTSMFYDYPDLAKAVEQFDDL